jgi:hypothetical protein
VAEFGLDVFDERRGIVPAPIDRDAEAPVGTTVTASTHHPAPYPVEIVL